MKGKVENGTELRHSNYLGHYCNYNHHRDSQNRHFQLQHSIDVLSQTESTLKTKR